MTLLPVIIFVTVILSFLVIVFHYDNERYKYQSINWEVISNNPVLERLAVPDGWLVKLDNSICFYKEPQHKWIVR